MGDKIKLTIWNEFLTEKHDPEASRIYPKGIHGALAEYFGKQPDIEVRTATLEEPDHGLSDDIIASTDVLIWWGHDAHDRVDDRIVDKLQKRVWEGMGFIALHSSHYSKLFKRLMGTSCVLKWCESGEMERMWVIEPGHPIADGLKEYIEIPHNEMYGERFDVPDPDDTVFISWFPSGHVFRSGCCFHRNKGKIFYCSVGHSTFPLFYQAEILQILNNAVHWAKPIHSPRMTYSEAKGLEGCKA